jgi:hypothetical protein
MNDIAQHLLDGSERCPCKYLEKCGIEGKGLWEHRPQPQQIRQEGAQEQEGPGPMERLGNEAVERDDLGVLFSGD